MKQRKAAAYVKAIERARSISGAAEELGISQPALSAHLKKEEAFLGARIFDRSQTPLKLTEAGRAYLDYQQRCESLERELFAKVSDIGDLRTGKLSVGGPTSFNAAYLAPAIAEFSSLYPGIEVTVMDDTAANVAAAALAGHVDVFVAPRLESMDEFEAEELVAERAFLCVPPGWAVVEELPKPDEREFAVMKGRELERLAEHPFIMLRPDQRIGQMMRELLAENGVEPDRVIVAEQTLTSLALTMAGAGVSLVTEGALRFAGAAKMPARFLVDEGLCSRMLYILRPRNRYVSRAAEEFVRVLKETVV